MSATARTGMLLPKEHGAYGQLTLPIVTALAAGGASLAGLMLITSAIAAFVGHESVSILLGHRGSRARREQGPQATRWSMASAAISTVAGAIAILTIDNGAHWAIAVPAIPALALAVTAIRGQEKSWYGELLAAAAFAGLAVPVTMAGGGSATLGMSIAAPFALTFAAGTLAVRAVILRVRGGGNPRATAVARRSALLVTVGGAGVLAGLVALGLVPPVALVASVPGLVPVLLVVARPPHATRLATVGWTLVAASVCSAVILVAGS